MTSFKTVCATIVMVCASFSASAQEFFAVESVQQTGKSFFVLASSNKAVQVNPAIYKIVKATPDQYVVCYCECEEENLLTVALKSNIKRMVSEVDSVGFGATEDAYKLFFKDGTTYESKDEALLTINPGQKVEFTSIKGLTQNFWRHRTVPRSTPVSASVDVFSAPAPAANTIDDEIGSDDDLTASASVKTVTSRVSTFALK
ncbi:MAG: hypothetical protein VZR95_03905 [Alphaproteobacteria bacterium]